MTFQELLQQVTQMRCQEIRTRASNGLEVVIATPDMDELFGILNAYFIQPLKPPGEPVSAEASEIAKKYGGVWDNQTMYFKKNGNLSEVALIWPWNNGESSTLKMLQHE